MDRKSAISMWDAPAAEEENSNLMKADASVGVAIVGGGAGISTGIGATRLCRKDVTSVPGAPIISLLCQTAFTSNQILKSL